MSTGPIPKRSDQRIRRNKPDQPLLTILSNDSVAVPELMIEEPHKLVVEYYQAMQDSAQAKYFQPSDWMQAQYTLTLMDEQLKRPGAKNGQILSVINSALSELLVSEGARRRVRVEIETAKTQVTEQTTEDYLKGILGAV